MKISIEGVVYEFQADKLTLREAFRIHEQTGLNLKQWQDGLGEGNPYALGALAFLLKSRAGEQLDWSTFDFDLGSFDIDADEEDPGVDPTSGLAPATEPESATA